MLGFFGIFLWCIFAKKDRYGDYMMLTLGRCWWLQCQERSPTSGTNIEVDAAVVSFRTLRPNIFEMSARYSIEVKIWIFRFIDITAGSFCQKHQVSALSSNKRNICLNKYVEQTVSFITIKDPRSVGHGPDWVNKNEEFRTGPRPKKYWYLAVPGSLITTFN